MPNLRRVAEPRIDETLIDTSGRTVGRERMTEDVGASDDVPFLFGKRPLEVIVYLVLGVLGRVRAKVDRRRSPLGGRGSGLLTWEVRSLRFLLRATVPT